MLDPKTNRMDYGEQLIPDKEGYDLDYAIGTTYSLDLEAIMVLPVALFHSRLLDCSTNELHLDVLDAITRAADKIRVYCQKGKIKVPKKYYPLMAYWEKGISQIQMDSYINSFHPKVWIIRFTARDKSPYYRLLITSRNLTYAHDWDIAFSTEGYVGNSVLEKNRPLLNFLRYLEMRDGKNLPKEFVEDLLLVNFEIPDGFLSMSFHPIGIENPDISELYSNPIDKKNWDELLCISPFVDNKSIKNLNEKSSNKIYVLSGKEELDVISETLINDIGENRFYQFSEFIRDAERIDGLTDGSQLDISLQNLHAKVFLGSKSAYHHWFIGSANLTQPAFSRNIEFMAELKTDQNKLSPDKIFKLLTCIKDGNLPLFEPYQLNKRIIELTKKNIENEMRKLIYDISGLSFTGDLNSRLTETNNIWDIIIKCDASKLEIPDDFKVMIKPLSESEKLPIVLQAGSINEIHNFMGYNEVHLSPYLKVQIQYLNEIKKSFIVEMDINLPSSRLDSIFKSFIDSREKFMKYLSFLLSGSTPMPLELQMRTSDNNNKNEKPISFEVNSIYENLLVTLSRRPERINAIEKIIERLKEHKENDEPIISNDFLKLWNTFNEYIVRNSR